MLEKWKTSFPAPTGRERRTVYVYVPHEAQENPRKRFPVLYMFDGHNLFLDSDATYGKCWGLKEYLEYNDVPLIVVGVDCNHHPENGRLVEYAPFSFSAEGIGEVEGLGDKTMQWFTKNLKPKIDKRYPTLRGRNNTFVGGSSMGGLMSLYAVLKYNHIFSRAAALSPSIWVAPDEMNALADEAKLKSGTVVYMDYGQKELRNHRDMLAFFADYTARLMKKGVLVNSRIVPGGTHCEASCEKQLSFMMDTLLYKQD